MTKHMDDFLNIPHESELEESKEVAPAPQPAPPMVHADSAHETEAEEIRKRAMDLQDEIAEVARNVEPSKSARMFEVSGQHLKIALEASNSKEKRKLEAAKLKIEAARLKVDDDTVNSLNSGAEVIADRNALIKQLIAEDEVVDVEPEDELPVDEQLEDE